MSDIEAICNQLRELHRQRQGLHGAEKTMTLKIKSVCRRMCAGDKREAAVLYKAMEGKDSHHYAINAIAVCQPFIEARSVLHPRRMDAEKQMEKLAKQLPVSDWVDSVNGFGIMSLAAIIGEAGDLGNYSTVSKLWKRLGLAVIGDKRQQRVKGAKAHDHGYSPRRRSVVWNVGDTLFKAQSARMDKETGEITRPAGKYRDLYDRRKEYELPRVESNGHAHNRAKRVMEKELIKDLWVAWREAAKSKDEDNKIAA